LSLGVGLMSADILSGVFISISSKRTIGVSVALGDLAWLSRLEASVSG
jgi:hypothetical protein